MEQIKVVSTNVGLTELLGVRNGHEVYSAIRKQQTRKSKLDLDPRGFRDDQQTDTRILSDGKQVHGGPLRAVYVYPATHYPFWARELDQHLPWGAFGENLDVLGIDERTVFPGDIWEYPSGVELEVTTPPRLPFCHKLDMLRGEGTRLLTIATGRCGWFMQVNQPGPAPTTGLVCVTKRGPGPKSIADLFLENTRRDLTTPVPFFEAD